MAYLQFLGAAGTVTGSKHLVHTEDLQVLLDCGMFQGKKEWRERNWRDLPIPAREIDAVILTHAHLDHCGWIPRLFKEGYRGKVYATPATVDLCGVILPDSGHLQEEEAEYHNRKKTSKHEPALPLYTREEAEKSLRHFVAVDFHEPKRLGRSFEFEFVRAAHILGSAMTRVTLNEDGTARQLLFSGDIGRVRGNGEAECPGEVVAHGPEGGAGSGMDVLMMESTYGNRERPKSDARPELARIVRETHARGGSVVVPAFAVERTQKFLFLLKRLMEENEIPRVPVFADSPMAIRAVEIFLRHESEFTPETCELIRRFGSPLTWPGFTFATTPQESRRINETRYPCIIVSSSGMATGGRVLHHLRLKLPDPRNTILFIGFQAPGTRGAIIKSGAPEVRIFSEPVPIRAEVRALEQFSDHADTGELLTWLKTFTRPPRLTYLVHGEPEAASLMQTTLHKALGWEFRIAEYMQKVPL